MAHLFVPPSARALSSIVTAVSGAKLYFYDAGTTTPRVTYKTPDLSVAHPNPVLSNSVGVFPAIYIDAAAGPYKADMQSAAGVSLAGYPIDNLEVTELSAGPGSALTQTLLGEVLYPKTQAENDSLLDIDEQNIDVGINLRYGMDRTGVTDSTQGLFQLLRIAQASGFYGHPWFGAAGASPVITVLQGRYRLTGMNTLCTGTTLQGEGDPVNTTNHTRLIMDSSTASPPSGAGDNRNKAMFRLTRKSLSDVLMNGVCTFSVSQLEFLFVTIGSTFDLPLSGSGINPGNYPVGCTWLIDVDCTDVRFRRNVFQHSTRSMLFRNVPRSSTVRGDGVTGSSGIFMFFDENEWDAQSEHWRAENCHLGLTFRDEQFFSGTQVAVDGCTGSVSYDACVLETGANINFADVTNRFDLFRYHGRAELSTVGATIFVSYAKNVDIDIVMYGNSPQSGVVLYNCDGGRVRVVVQNSGYNASAGTGPDDYVAVVKLVGCHDVQVEVVITDTLGGGAYNGFGVLSVDSGERTALRNVVTSSVISAPFNGGPYRGQNRFINIAPGDFLGYNMTFPSGTALTSIQPSRIDLSHLPVSSAGLASGQAWNDTGTVKVIP